jgi:hypothetical protein
MHHHKMITCYFTDEQKYQARHFAKARAQKTGELKIYQDRNQYVDESKIEQDIFIGICAEFAVSNFFNHMKRKCSNPDLRILPNDKKSFDNDLTVHPGHLINVKTFDQTKRKDASWIFQLGKNGVDRSLTSTTLKHNYVLTKINLIQNSCTIMASITGKIISKYDLLKEPQLEHLKHQKKAIYYHDLKNLPIFEKFELMKKLDLAKYIEI